MRLKGAHFATLSWFVVVSAIGSLPACAPSTVRMTILHTNDLHGMLVPFNYPGSGPIGPEDNVGGLARRATLIKQIRSSSPDPVLVVDAGDTFTRGPWDKDFHGSVEIEAMNRMNYDMAAVGNGDLKAYAGPESQGVLLNLVKASTFPWLVANMTVTATGLPPDGMKPWIVRRVGGVPVCFFGLTTLKSVDYPQTVGWSIENPVQAAKRLVPEARKQCDILIAVTHLGVSRKSSIPSWDELLAGQVPGIDAIVGGDSHTFLLTPLTIQGPDGTVIPIVQTGEYGVRVGKLDLEFDKARDSGRGWRLKQFHGELIRLDESIPEDPDIETWLNKTLPPNKQ